MMEQSGKKKSSFKAGMYLLENLTSGMYNEPLSIYREYIQNAVDAIDLAILNSDNVERIINIDIDPFEKRITIRDNGVGIPAQMAEEVLSSIGSSNKHNTMLRGFRGIGRLGGIAFSEKAIFKTKANGEKVESIQIWDCRILRNLINSDNKFLTFKELFDRMTMFSQNNGQPAANSYFEVTLEGVSSFRNHVFDIERIRDYLCQVAPLPFNYDELSFAQEIDDYLSQSLAHYRSYSIYLNGEKLFKPYRNIIKTSQKKGGNDFINKIEYFSLKHGSSDHLAYGWYGKRKDLLGAIKRGEAYAGMRIRVGNILLGDSHLLDRCFREDRFNAYIVGEIHVANNNLIPNSRRDDFVDNRTKTLFYDATEKFIGLPISKEIRLCSRVSCENMKSVASFEKEESAIKSSEFARLTDSQPMNIHFESVTKNNISDGILNKIMECCKDCSKLSEILANDNL